MACCYIFCSIIGYFLIINFLLWIREDYKDIGTQLYHVSLFDMFVN